MQVIGTELLKEPFEDLKFVLNESGIVFFPSSQQHRDIKSQGLSYEDDYRGNAVAGVITQNRIEIRYHEAFSTERILNLWSCVLSIPVLAGRGFGILFYQGKAIS